MTKRCKSRRFTFIAAALGATLVASGLSLAFASDNGRYGIDYGDPTAFIVEEGNVDPGTYQGYLVFTRHCMACHGPDGLGSSFAPSLVKAAERRSFAEFAQTIAGGRDVLPGQVMPSFADDSTVLSNIPNIYRYMTARASGELGRGRPRVIEAMQEEAPENDQ
ncbi:MULTISPECIES: c-type cytochrome [Halomonadaceae]|uniref:c-type cytochrome n=1 Tax=Halomonadaceae TaxID=28256 RepID=UPI00159905AE|nr:MULTISPECIES: c-type cytochrome [Halomonas]QJQ96874.1 c-type cytochrome [Halomonas sp. PA5]